MLTKDSFPRKLSIFNPFFLARDFFCSLLFFVIHLNYKSTISDQYKPHTIHVFPAREIYIYIYIYVQLLKYRLIYLKID